MRKTNGQRLEDLIDAAAEVFAHKGFRRTRMDEVARAAGVSPGNVYNYVTSKEALFRLVMERTTDGGAWAPPDGPFPLDGSSTEETIAWVAKRLNFVDDFPLMEVALRKRTTRTPAKELAEVVGELFDVLLEMRYATAILERSAPDMPDLRRTFLEIRRELFARMTRYIERRVRSGAFLPVADPRATARLIVEATSWATRGRLNDPDRQTALPDDVARAALIELALRTLTGTNGKEADDLDPRTAR